MTLHLAAAERPTVHDGLASLAAHVRAQAPPRVVRRDDGLASLFEAELRLGLEAADPDRAYEAAAALWRRTGDGSRSHAAIARVLAGVGRAWAAGDCPVAHEHRVTAAATVVLTRLREQAPAPAGPPGVVLAVPPGEQHVLALQSLAQLLAAAGHVPDVVGELPVHELADAAAAARCVVLSVHTRSRTLTSTLSALRAAAPEALLVVGGPGAPRTAGADLVTSDPAELLAALEDARSPLTAREREVLQCVADGLSNHEAGALLHVTPGTVKTHLDHVYAKTGATGRAAAVATALRRGWIR